MKRYVQCGKDSIMIDMNQEPGQRVMLDQIDLTKSYRVTND